MFQSFFGVIFYPECLTYTTHKPFKAKLIQKVGMSVNQRETIYPYIVRDRILLEILAKYEGNFSIASWSYIKLANLSECLFFSQQAILI